MRGFDLEKSKLVGPTADHGPTATIEDIDRRFRKPLLVFFRRRSHRQDAEDLTQEVLLRMMRHPDVRTIDSLAAYIFQVATNLLRDSSRRMAVRRPVDLTDFSSEILPESQAREMLVEDIQPERVLLAKERLQIVVEALRELPERTRDIFVLYRLEGLRQREISLRLGISVSSVEKHLAKALEHVVTRVGRQ